MIFEEQALISNAASKVSEVVGAVTREIGKPRRYGSARPVSAQNEPSSHHG
jgi:hypothetical protein